MALIHTSVTMLTSRHALERKITTGGDMWRGGLFVKQLKKWVKPIFLSGCYRCIFHRTGNLAQLCQDFRISGGGGGVFNPPTQTPPHSTPLVQCTQLSGKTWHLYGTNSFQTPWSESLWQLSFFLNPNYDRGVKFTKTSLKTHIADQQSFRKVPHILPQAYCSLLSSGYSVARRLFGRQ